AAQGPFDANISGTAVYDAGSPTVAHTAVVSFTSSDGKTQFNFVFQLSAEACVVVESPTPTPTPTASPTPEQSVQGGTGTPAPSQPDTAMGAQGGPSPIPTIAFGMILFAALGTL